MLTTGEAIGVLRAIEHKVWEYDIPSPNVPEYREHHEACLDILKYIRGYIELIKKYDGIPSIADMYPTVNVTMYEDLEAVRDCKDQIEDFRAEMVSVKERGDE